MVKPDSCLGCSLANISDGFIKPEGEGTSGVVIIGEGGGYEEYLDALPFRPRAQAGSKLEEAFRLVERDTGRPCNRSNFLIHNLISCRPPGNELAGKGYEQSAISHCNRYFDPIVSGFHTTFHKTILALGNLPLKYLTGYSGIAEDKQSISHLRGFVLESKYGLVVPSYHPSFIRRGNNTLTPILVEDLKKALGVARGEYKDYPLNKGYTPPTYQVTPGIDEAWAFYHKCKDNERWPIIYDIETPDTASIDEDEREELENLEILLVQFATQGVDGIAFPWMGDYIKVIKLLMALPNPKVGHNSWNFDDPRLRAKGVVINGVSHDTMWMFKHWSPKLPRGLQHIASLFGFPFPWKHLYKTDLNYYGCADVHAGKLIISVLPKLMKERGVWEGYKRYVVGKHPILERAREVGLPISDEKRLGLRDELIIERGVVDSELQGMIPDVVKNIKPRRKDKETGELDYGYVRSEPKIVKEGTREYTEACERANGRRVVDLQTYLERKYNLVNANFRESDTGNIIQRWCIVEPFKASKEQLVKYLKWKREKVTGQAEETRERRDKLIRESGHTEETKALTVQAREYDDLARDYEIPKNLKTKRDTTGKKDLEEMFFRTGDVVLEKVMNIRSIDMNLNNAIPNWEPHRDGRVHTMWGYGAPTGQIDSRGPNVLNAAKHTDIGRRFRKIIEAPEGYCFVEGDKKSFHVAMMGYSANDRGYIRYSQLDPHSILGSHIDPSILGQAISLKWSDKDILEASALFKKRCKEIKAKDPIHGIDVRQDLAKPTVLGNQLELGAKKLQRQNQRFIHSIAQAERLQDIVKGMFNKPEVYKRWIKEKAFRDTYLINEFGRIQYFYDVFKFVWNKRIGKWDKSDGGGARHPIAYRVQSPAFGMIDEELLEMEEGGYCERFNFLLSIHDSIVCMPKIEERDLCIETMHRIMSKPCPQLVNEATGPSGLVVGVEISVGKNWGEMKEVKI